MKYFSFAFALCCIIFSNAFAQDDELDNLDFEMQDYEQFEEESAPYFAIGGGPVLNLIFLNYEDINKLNIFGSDSKENEYNLDGLLFQFGAQGVITLGLIPNVRIGLIGMGGQKTFDNPLTAKIESNGDSINVNSNIKFYTGYTGINIDYAIIPFRDFSFAVIPGLMLGWGVINVESFRTQSQIDWESYNPMDDNINLYSKIESSYWNIMPMISFEYCPTFLSMFRASVGYSTSFSHDWYLNGNKDAKVNNVPSGISSDGLTIQFAIMLGIFNY